MSRIGTLNSTRPEYDNLLTFIAEYAVNGSFDNELALETARYCFMDTIGCGLLALKYKQCTKLLGPVVPGAFLANGARVPGTNFELEPIQAAFNIGTMVRWLDFNDTWLAAEWGHPSDNLGAILAIADYQSRSQSSLSMRDVLNAMIKAHEIQGILALENSFNKVGLDHVLLVKIASTAVATAMLGGTIEQVKDALSNAWVDGASLRTYRHAPNTGSRKSWAAGDATSRAVRLAYIALSGEMGYPSALTADTWGFQDVLFAGKPIFLSQNLDSYVMENILFKISYPAEFHAQTAVECAIQLHSQVKDHISEIDKILLETQESGFRIINKKGPLNNPADRDHCLQYMVAVGLIYGTLTADHYEDDVAADSRIDFLRQKMICSENPLYSEEYLEPSKRSIANSVQVTFADGTKTDKIEIHYPIGHKFRRSEGIPLLREKFTRNIQTILPPEKCEQLEEICSEQQLFESCSVDQIMTLLCGNYLGENQ